MRKQRSEERLRHVTNLRDNLAKELALLEGSRVRWESATAAAARARKKQLALTRPPNILLITTDQQRRDSIGCYFKAIESSSKSHLDAYLGPESHRRASDYILLKPDTPHLDRLASEGVRFEEAFAAAPVCSPSRASLLLGAHTPVHGVLENGLGSFEPRLRPIASILTEDLGYDTALVGKAGVTPVTALGFSFMDVLGDGSEWRDSGTPLGDYLETYLVNSTMLWLLEKHRALEASLGLNSKFNGEKPDEIQKPWFLHLSMASPHPPNTLPVGWQLRYSLDRQNHKNIKERLSTSSVSSQLLSVNFELGDFERLPTQSRVLQGMDCVTDCKAPPFFNQSRAFPPDLLGEPDHAHIATMRERYYNLVAYVDDQIGRLLDLLDGRSSSSSSSPPAFSGLHLFRENTLVIFSSDHGSMLHDHGIPDKHTLLGEAPRVPLILRWPGVIVPHSVATFASLLDVPATIVAAAASSSRHSHSFFSGFNLLAQPPAHAERKEVIGEIARASFWSPRSAVVVCDFLGFGVITKRWKLFYYPQDDEGFLFHRESDPYDRFNRWGLDGIGVGQLVLKGAKLLPSRERKPLRAGDRTITSRLLRALLRWRARQSRLLAFLDVSTQNYTKWTLQSEHHGIALRAIDAEIDLQNAVADL